MHIIPDVRPCAHTTLPGWRLVAGYVGTVAGLRAALLAATRPVLGGTR